MPDNSGMDYAPQNELGVVYLFAQLARRRYGLRIEKIQPGYPDCIAIRNGKRVRIEFEYCSRNFKSHGHDPDKCDWIVCWIHDWPQVPKNIRVVELRDVYRLGFDVWFLPVADPYKEDLASSQSNSSWSVPSGATIGDLLLYYRTAPDSHVRDIFLLTSPVQHVDADWKPGKDWMGSIRRVCVLKAPIHLSQLRNHPVLRNAGFVRGGVRTRYRVTDNWPELYDLIVTRNPAAARSLKNYGPERVA